MLSFFYLNVHSSHFLLRPKRLFSVINPLKPQSSIISFLHWLLFLFLCHLGGDWGSYKQYAICWRVPGTLLAKISGKGGGGRIISVSNAKLESTVALFECETWDVCSPLLRRGSLCPPTVHNILTTYPVRKRDSDLHALQVTGTSFYRMGFLPILPSQ